MNTAQRQWIEALESGRYTQGTGQLRTRGTRGKRFCCLGVLTREFDTAFDRWSEPHAPALENHPQVRARIPWAVI